MSADDTKLRRQYVKRCDLRDFAEPTISARISEIVPGLQPPEHLRRKYWEYAMLTLFLEDLGLLREDAQILSVGAGHETVTCLWLANRVGKVVATDIYGSGSFGEHEASRSMLSDPASFSPYPYRESHLEALHMDASKLEFPDDSFDAVFCLSSIEHVGSRADIRRSSAEMGRVLRRGGAAFIVNNKLSRTRRVELAQRPGSRKPGYQRPPVRGDPDLHASNARFRDRRAERPRVAATVRYDTSRKP